MPKSKSKRRYQPPPRKKPKPSPKWYGVLILSLWGLGVLVVVLNYLGLMPGFSPLHVSGDTNNFYLFAGLGLIAAGFLAATQWR
jgi:hypothetical protein